MLDVFKLSKEQLYDLYEVELEDDGSVYDIVEDRTFKSVAAWNTYMQQQERGGSHIEKFGGRWGFDDE